MATAALVETCSW